MGCTKHSLHLPDMKPRYTLHIIFTYPALRIVLVCNIYNSTSTNEKSTQPIGNTPSKLPQWSMLKFQEKSYFFFQNKQLLYLTSQGFKDSMAYLQPRHKPSSQHQTLLQGVTTHTCRYLFGHNSRKRTK